MWWLVEVEKAPQAQAYYKNAQTAARGAATSRQSPLPGSDAVCCIKRGVLGPRGGHRLGTPGGDPWCPCEEG